jgi:hypothetical protein
MVDHEARDSGQVWPMLWLYQRCNLSSRSGINVVKRNMYSWSPFYKLRRALISATNKVLLDCGE